MLNLADHLTARKLDPTNPLDMYIAQSCSKDLGMHLKDLFYDISYLNRPSMYQSQYGIYLKNTPIGYLDISKIYITDMDEWVNLMYAILREHRNKGYAKKIVSAVTREILLDRVEVIKSVHLQIRPNNVASIKTAKAAGFVERLEEYDTDSSHSYVKTRWMLEIEKTL